jgi:hypothetical protein
MKTLKRFETYILNYTFCLCIKYNPIGSLKKHLFFKEMQNQKNRKEKVMDDEEDENEGGTENDEEEAHQPPRKITRSRKGRQCRQKEYYYLKTVKSVGELDKLRLKVIAK